MDMLPQLELGQAITFSFFFSLMFSVGTHLLVLPIT